MENRTRVVVYGNTLSMAGIAASLKDATTLEVLCVDPREPALRQSLLELDPKTILFDRTLPHPELELTLLREQPCLLLVGVDPCSDEVLVLTGQRNRIVSVRELVHLVSASAQQSSVEKNSKGDIEGGSFEKK